MKVERIDGTRHRKILTAMITDPIVLGEISVKWEHGMFGSPDADTIGTLCVNHWKRYAKPPGNDLEGLVTNWAERQDNELIKRVELLLAGLSDEHKQNGKPHNPAFLIDMASTLFRKVRASKLKEGIQGALDAGQVDQAEALIASYAKLQLGESGVVNPFNDEQEIEGVFIAPPEPLVVYPDAIGQLVNQELTRDALVAFTAPEKTGKTFMLIDVAYRAMCQRKRVLFFEVGDMSKHQIERRLMVRVAGHPAYSTKGWPLDINFPEKLTVAENEAAVEHEVLSFDGPLDYHKAKRACGILIKNKVRSNQPYFKLSCHANSTINVAGMVAIIQELERDGWLPDVIVIDYADILAPPAGGNKMDLRDQINTTWKQLRALSQERHCLVVTATQANAASYKKNDAPLDRSNFSEDKRKLSHVTGMLGLNVNGEEKTKGTMRVNWIALREGEFSHRRCVHVASCLALANPVVLSSF